MRGNKPGNKHVALLRGINVGGNNIIKMSDLIRCFEGMGFKDVSTYIQSGNVLFRTSEEDIITLTNGIEKELSERFSYSSKIVVITHKQMTHIVEDAPDRFGQEPERYRYDVLFLKDPLTSMEVMEKLKPREGVDKAFRGDKAVYFSRLISRASQSRLTKVNSLAIYKNITVRNWNTTVRLLQMMNEPA